MVDFVVYFYNNLSMSEKTDFQSRQGADKGLSVGGKAIFSLLCILFNPLLLLIPAYLLWHEKSPKKWADALRIFKYIIIVLLALAIFGIVMSFILVSINKAREKARTTVLYYPIGYCDM